MDDINKLVNQNLYKEIHDKIFGNNLLFLSMDIVNSTKYKYDNSLNGHSLIKNRLDEVTAIVENEMSNYHLWKVLGDELIFLRIVIPEEIDNLNNELNKITEVLGIINSSEKLLKIKSTSWLVEISKKEDTLEAYNYETLANNIDMSKTPITIFIKDNLTYTRDSKSDFKKVIHDEENDISSLINNLLKEVIKLNNENTEEILELQNSYSDKITILENMQRSISIKEIIKSIDFIGSQMDLGFRLSSNAKKEQLLISYDIVSKIKKKFEGRQNSDVKQHVFIQKFEELKGIYDNKPYPISFWNEGNQLETYIEKTFYKCLETKDDIDKVHKYNVEYNKVNHNIAEEIWSNDE